ncbi:unnamed protein product [Parajaminaea phylloscopi]
MHVPYFSKLIALALVALFVGQGDAKNCKAVGSTAGSVVIFKDNAQVGSVQQDPCSGDKNFAIPSQLPYTFVWSAHCDKNNFKDCKGAYASETNLLGNPPDGTQCTIEFDC